MNKNNLLVAMLFATCASRAIAGDVVVIVNKANENVVDKASVAKIYIGESKTWAGGGSIVAYDLPDDNPARAAFSSDVVGKSQASLKSLWTQNTFTGKAVPPKVVASDDEVKKAVAANKNAIGYVSAASADGTVKVVK